jgi:hypothetical protein
VSVDDGPNGRHEAPRDQIVEAALPRLEGFPSRTEIQGQKLPHEDRPESLGQLIHAAVRRAIEIAMDEEPTAALGARPDAPFSPDPKITQATRAWATRS